MECLPLTGLSILLLLVVGAGFVAGDPGAQRAELEPALVYVQESHVGYYEEHLARLALQETACR
jgi:hypothetical protein